MNCLRKALFAVLIVFVAQSAFASTTLRLSTLYKPGTPGVEAINQFAQEVESKTNGDVKIKVYPASQLGDWTQVTAAVIQGSIDMAMQPLAASFDKRLAIGWFPYMCPTLKDAQQAYSPGGFVFKTIDKIIDKRGLQLLAVWGSGMGGAGFAGSVNDPTNPAATHNLKVRVWPGGQTHIELMKVLGYNPTTVPWSDLYTALQTGVVDGQVGGTAKMTLENFKDVTKTWIQFNDHFEPGWLFINKARLASLPDKDRKAVEEAASNMTRQRFEELPKLQEKVFDEMRAAGIDVIILNQEQLEAFTKRARQKAWPKIGNLVGDQIMTEIKANVESD